MICLPSYDTEEEIPEAFKSEFSEVNGKWQLKKSAIPGAGVIFNDEIATVTKNKDRAIQQKQKANKRADKLQEEVDTLTDKVDGIDTDSVILSKEDGAEYEKLKAIGSAKEITDKLDEHTTLKEFKQIEDEKSEIATVAQAAGVNPGVLQSWKRDGVEGKDIEEFSVITEKDTNQNEVTKVYVKMKVKKDGKEVIEQFDMMTKAKELLPDWKFNALTVVDSNQQTNTNTNQVQTNTAGGVPATTGVVLPGNVGGSNNNGQNNNNGGDIFDNFKSSRDDVKSPFSKQPATK